MNLNTLHYYQPKTPNFGDAFNVHLNEFLQLEEFMHPSLGVGSILTRDFLSQRGLLDQELLVLGSGCRSANTFAISTRKGSFVRGPLSEKALKGTVPFVSDGAYLFIFSDLFEEIKKSTEKKYKLSIVPYFRSLPFIDWNEVGKQFNIHIIDPTLPKGLSETLREVAASELVIAEAMHGAIFSDIFRVPWIKLDFLARSFESKEVNTFKWNDWLKSIGKEDSPSINTKVYHRPIATAKNYTLKNAYINLFAKRNKRLLYKALEQFLREPDGYLSSSTTYQQISDHLSSHLNMIRR